MRAVQHGYMHTILDRLNRTACGTWAHAYDTVQHASSRAVRHGRTRVAFFPLVPPAVPGCWLWFWFPRKGPALVHGPWSLRSVVHALLLHTGALWRSSPPRLPSTGGSGRDRGRGLADLEHGSRAPQNPTLTTALLEIAGTFFSTFHVPRGRPTPDLAPADLARYTLHRCEASLPHTT